ncbi:MAG: FAD-dependent thymidylate synthase [Planctomycetota bacterium]|nr:MAG: FAD-dependent thymidylate synthase [Planctomycetota bacterium]
MPRANGLECVTLPPPGQRMSTTQLSMPAGAIETLDDGIGFIALVDRMQQDPALKVVNAARISYDKQKDTFEEKDQGLVKFLWKHGHTSPYRHSFFTFHWKAPLFVFRQAFKYQVGSSWRKYEIDGVAVSLEVFDVMFDTDKGCSWNEISGRYVKWTPEFYAPLRMRANPSHGNKQASVELPADFDHEGERQRMLAECQAAFRTYEDRIERGVAKEIARTCLPQSLYTQAYWTVSLQGLLHFFDQRLKPDAQFEIRRYAQGLYELMREDIERLGIAIEDFS